MHLLCHSLWVLEVRGQLGPLLRVSQNPKRGVSQAMFSAGGLIGEGSTARLIQAQVEVTGLRRGWRAWCFAGCWWETTCSSQRPPYCLGYTKHPAHVQREKVVQDMTTRSLESWGSAYHRLTCASKGTSLSTFPPKPLATPPQIHLDHLSLFPVPGGFFFPPLTAPTDLLKPRGRRQEERTGLGSQSLLRPSWPSVLIVTPGSPLPALD